MKKTFERSEISNRAREFLSHWRGPNLSDEEFDKLVEKETKLTIKQMRANGKEVE